MIKMGEIYIKCGKNAKKMIKTYIKMGENWGEK
jgi:hypothetical protein